MRTTAASLLIALSTLPFMLKGSDTKEPKNPSVHEVVEVSHESNPIKTGTTGQSSSESVDPLLYTHYVSNIQGKEERANAINQIKDGFAPYTKHPESMMTLLNGLAWNEYVKDIDKKSPKEVAESIVELVKNYKFAPFAAVFLAKKGVDPGHANSYLEKAQKRIPYQLPIAQLIIHDVPIEFYLKHRSHDPSLSIHDYNQIKIRELLEASGEKDVAKIMDEMKRMYPHFGFAYPKHFVKSYQMIKSMEKDSNFKLENVVLYLLPNYKPGHDPGTRYDSAFILSAFPIDDLDKLGFNVILASYNHDFEIEQIANEVSGNNNSTPGTEWPLTAMAIGGHGFGHKLNISDVPFDIGFSEEKHGSSILSVNDIGIFSGLRSCFKQGIPVTIVLDSCSTASPKALPQSLFQFSRSELPSNFLVQAPEIDTFIYGAYKKNQLPYFVFDGAKIGYGSKD